MPGPSRGRGGGRGKFTKTVAAKELFSQLESGENYTPLNGGEDVVGGSTLFGTPSQAASSFAKQSQHLNSFCTESSACEFVAEKGSVSPSRSDACYSPTSTATRGSEGGNEGSNTFRILVATDNHIGHKENDPVRGSDSFKTFEEILCIAKALEVDFLLHSGDLFDVQTPSTSTMYRVAQMMRQHCLGKNETKFDIVYPSSGQGFGVSCSGSKHSHLETSHCPLKFGANTADPNINISLPVYMIHGNHDDPGGSSNLSALDLLEVSHLINYYGKTRDLDNIEIAPIILKKGQTHVALYGLGNIRDERLHRAFQGGKVAFLAPGERDIPNPGSTFNIMTVHQNRYKGSSGGAPSKNSIHESMLPSLMHLVIWGHEHDCIIEPQESVKGEFHIIQPGSSVQTSCSAGEAVAKNICLIEVCGNRFRSTPIPLQTVRPFAHAEVSLSQCGLMTSDEKEIWEVLTQRVQKMLVETESTLPERNKAYKQGCPALYDAISHLLPRDRKLLPVIRLRVEHSGFPTISSARFGLTFGESIANSQEILHFHKKGTVRGVPIDKSVPNLEVVATAQTDTTDVHDIIFHFIEDAETALSLLPEPDLNLAVQKYAVKMDAGAITTFVDSRIQTIHREALEETSPDEDLAEWIKQKTATMRAEYMAKDRTPKQEQLLGALQNMPPLPVSPSGSSDLALPREDKKITLKATKQPKSSFPVPVKLPAMIIQDVDEPPPMNEMCDTIDNSQDTDHPNSSSPVYTGNSSQEIVGPLKCADNKKRKIDTKTSIVHAIQRDMNKPILQPTQPQQQYLSQAGAIKTPVSGRSPRVASTCVGSVGSGARTDWTGSESKSEANSVSSFGGSLRGTLGGGGASHGFFQGSMQGSLHSSLGGQNRWIDNNIQESLPIRFKTVGMPTNKHSNFPSDSAMVDVDEDLDAAFASGTAINGAPAWR